MENSVTKALKAAGFPEVESKIASSTIANKVISGIQKRTLKLDECVTKLRECTQTSLVNKTLSQSVAWIFVVLGTHEKDMGRLLQLNLID